MRPIRPKKKSYAALHAPCGNKAQKLRHIGVAIEDVDFRAPRKLDRALFQQLATGRWIKDAHDLMITGPCGIGKTWLACTLGQKGRGTAEQHIKEGILGLISTLRGPPSGVICA